MEKLLIAALTACILSGCTKEATVETVVLTRTAKLAPVVRSCDRVVPQIEHQPLNFLQKQVLAQYKVADAKGREDILRKYSDQVGLIVDELLKTHVQNRQLKRYLKACSLHIHRQHRG
jgi:hypothetical protein